MTLLTIHAVKEFLKFNHQMIIDFALMLKEKAVSGDYALIQKIS